ncbi:MAG: acyl carrier protein [Dehalococcoidia bacterium]
MELRTELLQFVKESLLRGEQDVGPEDSLIDRGIIDSIGLMQLMSFLEERTGTRIPDHYVTPDNFQSVVAMEQMLEELKTREVG